MNISRYQGIYRFGKAYGFMLENDPHASGSVDRVLAKLWYASAPRPPNTCTQDTLQRAPDTRRAFVRRWNDTWPKPEHRRGLLMRW